MKRRNITEKILDSLGDTPVVLLNGARQTGKSTLVQAIAEKDHPARYITLDTASILAAIRQDASGFLDAFDAPVVIDEVQRAPELFTAIKEQIDRRRTPGRFLLTGSTNIFLVPRLSESLAGRMELLNLWPFSQGEQAGTQETFVDDLFGETIAIQPQAQFQTPQSLHQKIVGGGYPEASARARDDRRSAWFESYITTILQRDIRDLANIEGLTAMPRLLAVIAGRSPSLLNYAELSRTLAMPQTTLKRYMALLEAAFLIQHIPAWSSNLTKRTVRSPKLVMTDTGLMAHLAGINQQRLAAGYMTGPLFETFVIMELKKQITWSITRPSMFHFRTQTGQEVDIVLESPAGMLVGIEVKASATISAHDVRGLKAFAETADRKFQRGIILYTGTEMIPFGNNLFAIPVQLLWQPARAEQTK